MLFDSVILIDCVNSESSLLAQRIVVEWGSMLSRQLQKKDCQELEVCAIPTLPIYRK